MINLIQRSKPSDWPICDFDTKSITQLLWWLSQHLLATNTKIGSFCDLEPSYGVAFFTITKKEQRGIFPPPYLRLEGKFTLLGGVLFGVSTIRENDPEMEQ